MSGAGKRYMAGIMPAYKITGIKKSRIYYSALFVLPYLIGLPPGMGGFRLVPKLTQAR